MKSILFLPVLVMFLIWDTKADPIYFELDFDQVLQKAQQDQRLVFCFGAAVNSRSRGSQFVNGWNVRRSLAQYMNGHYYNLILDGSHSAIMNRYGNVLNDGFLVLSPYGKVLWESNLYGPIHPNHLLEKLTQLYENHFFISSELNHQIKSISDSSFLVLLDSIKSTGNMKGISNIVEHYFMMKEDKSNIEHMDLFVQNMSRIDPYIVDLYIDDVSRKNLNSPMFKEALATHLLLRHQRPHSKAARNKALSRMYQLKISRLEHIEAYLSAIRIFYIKDDEKIQERDYERASIDLLTRYTSCANLELMREAVTRLYLSISVKESDCKLVKKSLSRYAERHQSFVHYDFLSVIQAKIGQETESVQSIKKANHLAVDNQLKYRPLLNTLRLHAASN